MKLVVGLGNPGPQYVWTRHNVGFHVVEELARREKVIFEAGRKLSELVDWKGRTDFAFARSQRLDALFVEPLCFMNLSGDVVAPLVRDLCGGDPSSSMVVYDDLDLPLGALRLRAFGGAGTHNGMRSIVQRLASDRFPRLRVGIGPARTDAARHVLERFTDREQPEIEVSVAQAADAIADWLASGDIDACMTRYHSRWNQGA
jgi:PTH1 family peptidyl-tRNA hydrolase